MVLTPQNRFGRQGAAYLATWLTDVGLGDHNKAVDQVISLRYPSYAVRHPNHVVWLNHTMREYYDQWETFKARLSWKGRIKEGTRRQLIHAADRYLLTRNVRKVYAQSRTISARLERWGGIKPETALSATAAARLSLRRLRRLYFRGVAPCADEAAVASD